MTLDEGVSGTTIGEAACRYFRVAALKPEQSAVMTAVIDGRDVLGVLPTGFGKSLCYQLPAVVKGGVCLVIEPTVSLVRDQAASLRSKGFTVSDLTASTGWRERYRQIDEVTSGGGFIIVSPEMALSLIKRDDLSPRLISLIAIDEAHCYHEWGRSFRPDYRLLPEALAMMPRAARICLTASATPDCRRSICDDLLRDPFVMRAGLDRPNIRFSVRSDVFVSGSDVDEGLQTYLASRQQVPTLVYRSSRTGAEATAQAMSPARRAGVYHGGLEPVLRDQVQRDFMAGDLDLVSATTAFGMGIDKPDIGLVVHLDLPTDLESCHQQNGRAGRDGTAAEAVLLRRPGDVGRAYARLRDLEGEKRQRAAVGLEWVMAMIEAPRCRNRAILWRFGERLEHACGHCDLCASRQHDLVDQASVFANLAQVLIDLRHPLGLGQVSAFCSGFRSEAMERQGLDRRPDFGLMRCGIDQARSILRQWLAEGLLGLDDETGHVAVTPAGAAVIRKQAGAFVRSPRQALRRPRLGDGLPATVTALWTDLLRLREEDPVYAGLSEQDILEIASGRIDKIELDGGAIDRLRPRLDQAHERPRPKGFDV